MNKLSSGFIFISASQMITVLGGLIINIFLSRYLGKDGYGIYSLIISGIMMVGISLVSNGFPQTLSKYISEGKYELKAFVTKIFLMQIIESLIILVLYIVFSPLLSIILKEDDLFGYLVIASFIIPTQAIVSFLVGLYNGLRMFGNQAALVSLFSFFKVTCIISFTYLFGIKGAIFGFFMSTLFVSLLFIFKARKYFTRRFNFSIIKDIMPFFLRITLFSIELSLLLSLDLNCLKLFLNYNQNEQLGIYSAGAVIAKTSFFLIISFSGVMFPIISNLLANDKLNEAQQQIGNMIKISSVFLLPIVITLVFLSPVLVNLFYGVEYSSSSSIVSILVFSYSILGYFVIFANILNSIGEVKTINIISIITIAIDIILLYFLIKALSIKGAAIATTISSLIGLISLIIILLQKIGIKMETMSILRISIIGLIIFGISNAFLVFLTKNVIFWVGILIIETILYFTVLHLTNDFYVLYVIREYYSKYSKWLKNQRKNN